MRDFLSQFFVGDADYSAYEPYLRESWLKPLFAEVKIVNGIGDQEKWYSMISPTELKSLRDRIDIDFAPTNPKRFAPADPVSLDLFVKNIDQLLVKVYEVNALNFYLLNRREVNTDIVPGSGSSPIRSNLTDLTRSTCAGWGGRLNSPSWRASAGTWVIEFIGNGRSSRALVRKGKLQFLSRPSASGSLMQIFDESNQLVDDASVWLAGREYKADEKGVVNVPFSNQPGRVPVVLVSDGFASLDRFEHPAENYQFDAGFHVERETLLPGQEAVVVIRPALALNGQPINLGLLKNTRLSIVSTDLDGIGSSAEAPGFELASTGSRFSNSKSPSASPRSSSR